MPPWVPAGVPYRFPPPALRDCRPKAAPTRLCLWASTAWASPQTWPRWGTERNRSGRSLHGTASVCGSPARPEWKRPRFRAPRAWFAYTNPPTLCCCHLMCASVLARPLPLPQVAYWLLQNGIKVMIAACDTFRSGAVEQLKTHCARLQVGPQHPVPAPRQQAPAGRLPAPGTACEMAGTRSPAPCMLRATGRRSGLQDAAATSRPRLAAMPDQGLTPPPDHATPPLTPAQSTHTHTPPHPSPGPPV